MALPTFTIRNLMEAGVHFGHHSSRWNPKMAPYLYGVRNSIHIINIEHTVTQLQNAMKIAKNIVSRGGRVLWVGTKKRQAWSIIRNAAEHSGQYYMNYRWLGGTLTNWRTIQSSIHRLKEYEAKASTESGFTKKEILRYNREKDKLELVLGGIREMSRLPDLLIVLDAKGDSIAITEARKLKIPTIGIVDSNCDPQAVDYPIFGNDDSIKAIQLYCDLLGGSIVEGLKEQISHVGNEGPQDRRRRGPVQNQNRPRREGKEAAPTEAPVEAHEEPIQVLNLADPSTPTA